MQFGIPYTLCYHIEHMQTIEEKFPEKAQVVMHIVLYYSRYPITRYLLFIILDQVNLDYITVIRTSHQSLVISDNHPLRFHTVIRLITSLLENRISKSRLSIVFRTICSLQKGDQGSIKSFSYYSWIQFAYNVSRNTINPGCKGIIYQVLCALREANKFKVVTSFINHFILHFNYQYIGITQVFMSTMFCIYAGVILNYIR